VLGSACDCRSESYQMGTTDETAAEAENQELSSTQHFTVISKHSHPEGASTHDSHTQKFKPQSHNCKIMKHAVLQMGFSPVSMTFRLDGLEGSAVTKAGFAAENGQNYAVVALAAAEAFPEGSLDGAVFHWGVASADEGACWEAAPSGWRSDPAQSNSAG